MDFFLARSCVAALALLSGSAWAQEKSAEAKTEAFSFSGTVAATTDYVYRGLTLSKGRPAIQSSLTVQHETGLFASVSLSNVNLDGGGYIEIASSAGFTQEIGNLRYAVMLNHYGYPQQDRGSEISFFEFGAIGAYTWDKLKFTAQTYLSPNTSGPLGGRSYYLNGGLAYTVVDGLEVSAGVGRSIYQMSNDYSDFNATVAYTWEPATLQVKYTTTRPSLPGFGGDRITASLTFGF
ncbi:TorF family putative porin [Paracraurococcus lichenis]|uniref:TorF family putative porin n=1 Tax=Paracraurococcus lichenis TaxID=3064888 RepID=A0ABT9E9H8_9PROT|nr:TorF family putative porin [Paracraurococcus sp. LOR1-02]MDO9712715.1 TorF family putative porin [Paracraurococcus sp. LOR1-02]